MLLNLSNWFVFNLLNFAGDSKAGEILSFFIYDTLKIIFLLFSVIFIIGVLRSYIPQQKLKDWLHQKGYKAYLFAAFFGAVTPFCSCSSLPIFFGMIAAGIPLGVVFTFLIISPLINEYLLVIMIDSFGWKISFLYLLSGLMIGIFAGLVLGKLKLERFIDENFFNDENNNDENFQGFKSRLIFGLKEALDITKSIWLWVVAGIAAGALIHNYVPQELVEAVIARAGIFGVPIAVLMGVPMYGSCAAIVPIALVLFQKGLPLGTALSFMMAISALSLPAAIVMRRAVKTEFILIFFSVTTIGIIFTGYLFNLLGEFI
ncbi:MAG: permease [Elusimicrobia bacterium]|nr:permease [Elusimicrobiota bacterium]